MEKIRKALIHKLLKDFHYKNKDKSMNLLSFQLGVYFITELTRQDIKEGERHWIYEKHGDLSTDFHNVMGGEIIPDSKISDAKDTLIQVGLITERRARAKLRLVEEEGYGEKKHWFWYLNFDYAN